MNGFLLIDKPQEWTSRDVDSKLKRFLGVRKIGHAGTLDPNVTGLLVVLLGKATGLADLLPDETKTYVGTLLLGKETDTEDIWGNVLAEKEVKISPEKARETILSFQNKTYWQIPPMYSAKKIDGQKLYNLARQGKTIERKAVPVSIGKISIRSMELPRVTVEVTCGKGTYIRTLFSDMAKAMGECGTMESLRRTAHGAFSVSEAIPLREILTLSPEEAFKRILAMDSPFFAYPELVLKADHEKYARNGNRLQEEDFQTPPETEDAFFRIYSADHVFLALYQRDGKDYRPKKMLIE